MLSHFNDFVTLVCLIAEFVHICWSIFRSSIKITPGYLADLTLVEFGHVDCSQYGYVLSFLRHVVSFTHFLV